MSTETELILTMFCFDFVDIRDKKLFYIYQIFKLKINGYNTMTLNEF